MEKLDFRCHLCQVQFNYKDALAHLEKHNVPRMRCLLKCGDATMFEGAEGMRVHLQDSCAKQKVACADCQRVLKRGQVAAHLCRQGHRRVVAAKNAEIQKLRLKVKAYEESSQFLSQPAQRVLQITSERNKLEWDCQNLQLRIKQI